MQIATQGKSKNTLVKTVNKPQSLTVVSNAEREAKFIWNFLKSNYTYRDNNVFLGSLDIVKELNSFDCDDFARVCYEQLTKKGIEAKVIAIKIPAERNDDSRYHVICVYKDKNNWKWLDNTEFSSLAFDSYMKIPTWYYDKKVSCTEFNMKEIVKVPILYEDDYVEAKSSWSLSQ